MANTFRRNVVWAAIEAFLRDGLAIAVRILLALILLPDDFGLVGMAVLVTGLFEIAADFGFFAALVQRKTEELAEDDVRTAFTFNVVVSAALIAVTAVFLGPAAAVFFSDQRLTPVIAILSSICLIRSFALPGRVHLTRALDFKKQTMATIPANIIGAVVSIVLALLGTGYWALVWGPVATAAVYSISVLVISRSLPLFGFQFASWKNFAKYSKFIFGNQVVDYLTKNVDYFLAGKLLGSVALGYYTFAFMATDVIRNRLMAITNNVSFATIARKGGDQTEMHATYAKTLSLNVLLLLPIMIVICMHGHWLIDLVFRGKWNGSYVPMALLAVSVIFHSLTGGASTALRALGYAQVDFYLYLIKTLALGIPLMVVGVLFWGINGLAAAVLVSKVADVIVTLSVANKYIHFDYFKYFLSQRRLFLSGLAQLAISSLIFLPFAATSPAFEFFVLFLSCVPYPIFLRREVRSLFGSRMSRDA